MSVEAPERIWISGNFARRVAQEVFPDDVEYVRADKLEELAAALAEKDKEIAALREALEEIANGCDGRVGRDILPCRIARAALAQGADDERS